MVAFNQLSIFGRLVLLMLALALPLNVVIAEVIWDLVRKADQVQGTSLLSLARSIAAGVDAELGTYVALAETLSRSPALLESNLDAFKAEARRAFPVGGDDWVVVSDGDGQELMNTMAEAGHVLPRRNPLAIEAERRALSTRSIVITDLFRGALAQDWVASIEVPIFKDGQPFRVLAVIMRQGEFQRLLGAQRIPNTWVADIIDGQGRFIARVPHAEVGQLSPQGWRASKDQTGLFDLATVGGDALIQANAQPSTSNWKVGVAVKRADLKAATWDSVRWPVVLSGILSAGSLLLAGLLARQITGPISQLRRSFADISVEPARSISVGPPEIIALQDTLYRSAMERQEAGRALMVALSKLEHEMATREEAQAALAQSQRLEAVGQLAGGMAHDFNNVLAAISAYLDAVSLPGADEKVRNAIQGAMDAIQMGASLTRRLLFLSGRQGIGVEPLDLNDRLTGTIELLRRTLGDQVTVTLGCSPDPCRISANPGDVDNAILNLAINARDAMPGGGVLTIGTRHVTLGADAAGRIPDGQPGDYVVLTVSDTGHGMSPQALSRAMEPFFSTKEPGKSAGLGLATVRGTVRQSGGFITIDSAVGKGTSVHLYFPKAEAGSIVSDARPAAGEPRLGNGELILVVEDSDKVREATVSRLASLGYAVREAKTGPEAIALLESGEPVALVLSDIVMPGGMTGYDVAEWVRSMKPNLKVVLTSGYSDMPLAASEAVRSIEVLGKPYTREQLAYTLREALGR
jgi:signal transduction histidine kinase